MSVAIEAGSEPIAGYRLIHQLGRGGFGEVWKAEGPGGFHVALKFVRLAERVGPVELRALEVIRDIRHPHLLATFGAWQVDDLLIIAMELAERTLLDRHREAVGQGFEGIPAPEVHEYILEAAKGLDFLNEPRHPWAGEGFLGIQHRDVKPQNLLLVGGGVKVADFGLARVLEHTQASHTGSMTPAYAAPEFFDRRTSAHSDQYSLAVTYCHLRGGHLPFDGSLSEIMAGHLMRPPDLGMLPEGERAVVARAMAKDPKDRWPNCRAFVAALRSEAPAGRYDGPVPETSQPPDRAARLPRTEPATDVSGGRPLRSRPLIWSLLALPPAVALAFWAGGGFRPARPQGAVPPDPARVPPATSPIAEGRGRPDGPRRDQARAPRPGGEGARKGGGEGAPDRRGVVTPRAGEELSDRVRLSVKDLSSQDQSARAAAASRLARLGDEARGAVPAIEKLLASGDFRYDAYIDRFGRTAALYPEDPTDKVAALAALGKLAPDRVEPALVRLAGSEHDILRRWARERLAAIGPPKGSDGTSKRVEALIGGLSDESETNRTVAAALLAGLGDEARPAAPALEKLLSTDVYDYQAMINSSLNYYINPSDKAAALAALKKLAPDRIKPALARLAGSDKELLKVWALDRLPK